jgi:hypothetical protein
MLTMRHSLLLLATKLEARLGSATGCPPLAPEQSERGNATAYLAVS